MEGRTFHRLAMIIALTEIFLSFYILKMCFVGVGDGFGVGCFEDTRFQWKHGNKSYIFHPCSGELNFNFTNGVSEDLSIHFPDKISATISEMMKADAFGNFVASVGIFFSFGLFKVGFYNGNDSENVWWHIIVKNVYLAMFMIFGLLSFDFSRLLKDSGVDNFIFSKRFVVYMIYGVMFPILATIFDCKYISYIVANRFSTIRMRRAAAGG